MVPLDHGISMGPIDGIEKPARPLQAAATGGATCTALHKGLVHIAKRAVPDLPILLHVSASTDVGPDPHEKRLVASVEDARRMDCAGVSFHLNLGARTEAQMLQDAGHVTSEAAAAGLPVLGMIYPRGPAIADPHDPQLVAHAARLGAELGCDIVKVPYTGDAASFKHVVAGCPVPVIIAGGPRRTDAKSNPGAAHPPASFDQFLEDVANAAKAGARGVSIGRNVFQHSEPAKAMSAIAAAFP